MCNCHPFEKHPSARRFTPHLNRGQQLMERRWRGQKLHIRPGFPQLCLLLGILCFLPILGTFLHVVLPLLMHIFLLVLCVQPSDHVSKGEDVKVLFTFQACTHQHHFAKVQRREETRKQVKLHVCQAQILFKL